MTSAGWIVIIVAFAVGTLLLGISSAMLRSIRDERVPRPSWPQLIDESAGAAGVDLRLDMIDRLSIVDNDWSRSVLERALAEETDPQVRSAIDLALHRPSPTPALH